MYSVYDTPFKVFKQLKSYLIVPCSNIRQLQKLSWPGLNASTIRARGFRVSQFEAGLVTRLIKLT